MAKSRIIIVEGLSGTGKTTIGRYAAEKLGLPYFNKDAIKELMFDNIGWKDREWSQTLGKASYKILYWLAEEQLKAAKSLVIESNFRVNPDRENFLKLKEKYGAEVVEILCWAKGEVLIERFKKRAEGGERHPGHVDHLCYEEQEKRLIAGRTEALGLGRVIEVETTDWGKVNLDKIVKKIEGNGG